MGIAKVTTNYQVTLPRDIRKLEGINVGDTVFFVTEGGRIHFFKMDTKQVLKEAAGAWNGKINEDSVEYVKRLRREWGKRSKRFGL